MLECVQECTEGVLYGSGKGAPHTHRWITMIILAATTVTGFLGILSDLLSPQESRNLYSLAACTALVAINTALLLYLLGGGDVTTPIQAAVLLLPAAVTTLINVSGTSAMGGHLWPIYILIINCAMLFRLDEKYISAGVAAVVLWSTLVFAETALRFGLFDLPGGMSQHDRRQIVEEMMNCDGPLPCPRRTELVLVDWALMCLVFLGGYLVTRTFASQLYREKSATQATINTIRMIAERLSDYDLDTVHDILLANEGDLPQELADALRKLENNLRLYQPYLPHAMSQMHPDEEGEGAFSDVMVSPPGVVPEDVTVVFTDIRASTAIWEAAPDAMKRAMCIHNDLIRVATADCEGYEVKTIGDAFMVAFESTVYGVNFGLRVHTLLMGAAWPSSLLQIPLCAKTQHWSGLTTRIGVNSGPVSAEKNTLTGRMDYFGHTVNVASRLEQVCLPGAVAIPAELWSEVSGICAPAVAGSIQAVPLKGVKEPVRMVCLWPTALQGRRQNPLPAPQQALGEKGVGGGLPRLDSAYATVGTAQFLFSGNVARRMNDGLQSLIACLERSNGTIVTVLGSAVAVGWNIARRTEAHAETSLRFARLLESAFSGNAVALGLASGTVQHGPVGTTSHRYLTVVGRSVRVSYSLCKLAERHRRCCLFSAPEELDGLLPASLRAYLRSFSGHCSGEEQLPSAIFELVVEDGGAGKGKEPCV